MNNFWIFIFLLIIFFKTLVFWMLKSVLWDEVALDSQLIFQSSITASLMSLLGYLISKAKGKVSLRMKHIQYSLFFIFFGIAALDYFLYQPTVDKYLRNLLIWAAFAIFALIVWAGFIALYQKVENKDEIPFGSDSGKP